MCGMEMIARQEWMDVWKERLDNPIENAVSQRRRERKVLIEFDRSVTTACRYLIAVSFGRVRQRGMLVVIA